MKDFKTIVDKLRELRNKESEQNAEYRRKFRELYNAHDKQTNALKKEQREQIRELNEEFEELLNSINRGDIIEQARYLGIDVEPVVLQYIRGVITEFEFIEEVQRRHEASKS